MSDYDGRIQDWQVNTTNESSLDAKVSLDIMEALSNTQESKSGEWDTFFNNMPLSVLTSGRINWSHCPDDSFKQIWRHKQARLHDLYNAIHNVYSCYVPNNFFADLYREKLEQALDVLDGSGATEESVPLIKSKTNPIEVNAGKVLSKRANWVRIITLLEDYRKVGKTSILSAPTIADAEQALQVILSTLVNEVIE